MLQLCDLINILKINGKFIIKEREKQHIFTLEELKKAEDWHDVEVLSIDLDNKIITVDSCWRNKYDYDYDE